VSATGAGDRGGGQGDVLVTGDEDLLALQAHEGIRSITPRAFLESLDRYTPKT
jgi:predicted nucleic acid-binding protein